MTGISTGVGLFSGIDFTSLVDQLMTLQRAQVVRLEQRVAEFEARKTGLSALEANVVTLGSGITSLQSESTFNSFTATLSSGDQFTASVDETASAGTYRFQTLQTSSTQEWLSKGYTDSDSTPIGAGTITIADGGGLRSDIDLDVLNSGAGVRRGSIQITDRSGSSTTVDLSEAFSLNDVLDEINQASGISVAARAVGGQLVLEDTSGGGGTLSVAEVSTGLTATDLGILGSAAGTTLTGSEIYTVTEDFTLDMLNDGNAIRTVEGSTSLRITAADATVLDIDVSSATTLRDVIAAVNDHASNGGKVVASLSAGRLVLTDTTGGGGSLSVANINDGYVVEELGLDATVVGNVLTGNKLVAGANSVLLRNLNGGDGITQKGQISLTDRSGANTTIDLTSAESLDEVIEAINGAGLDLTASLDAIGTGITIEDTSGSTANNLTIADVGGSTIAADLNIAIDAAQNSVDSGNLALRYVNAASSLAEWAPDGKAFDDGNVKITDSNGVETTVNFSSATENIGDAIQRINAAVASSGAGIVARLNSTGDGFEIEDTAGGAGTMTIAEVDGSTAADLRILGSAVGGVINSRAATVVTLDADDTLDDLVTAINDGGAIATAAAFDTGTTFNPFRLQLRAGDSGKDGRLIIDDSGLNLSLSETQAGQDALLRVGSGATAFLRSSNDNSFTNAQPGIDLDVTAVGTSEVEVTVARDFSPIESAVKSFVSAYNTYVNASAEFMKYDVATETRGILQGSGAVLRVSQRLDSLAFSTADGNGNPDQIRTLQEIGIYATNGGKIGLDTARLQEVFDSNPEELSEFFLAEETGFGDRAQAVLDSLTDPFEGTFQREEDTLQASIDTQNARIEQWDEILEVRRARLLKQFVDMESALASLQAQQQGLAALSQLAPGPVTPTAG